MNVKTEREQTDRAIPTNFTESINAQVLAVFEDRLQGFQRDPFVEISPFAYRDWRAKVGLE